MTFPINQPLTFTLDAAPAHTKATLQLTAPVDPSPVPMATGKDPQSGKFVISKTYAMLLARATR